MVGRDRAADLVPVVTTGIGADVDAGDELDPVEIGETADAPCGLRLGRHVLVGNPARRVQHAAHEAAAHVGPVRTLGAVEPDQGEDLAPGIRALGHGELAVEIDRAGRAARGIAAGPALRGVVEAAGTDRQPHLGRRALGNEVGVALRVVEVVPESGHREGPFSCHGRECRRRPSRGRCGKRERGVGQAQRRGLDRSVHLLHQPAEMRRLDHVETPGAVLGREAPGVQRVADEGAAGLAVRVRQLRHGDHLIDDARQLEPGLRSVDLRREHLAIEVVELLVEDPDEPDVLRPRVLQMRQPADHLAAVQPVGAAHVRLAGLLRDAPRAGPCTTGSRAARRR